MGEEPFPSDVFTAGAIFCAPFVEAFGVTGASISVFTRGDRQATIGATDHMAADAEALQFTLGEGPHWQALSTGIPVICPDLSREVSCDWPVFLMAVKELGVQALFAFPMMMGAAVVGVVDLYSGSPHPFDQEAVSRANLMANRTAAAAVRHAMRSAQDHRSEETVLAPALRREVHQATGMVLVQLGVSATEAFARMQAHAFTTGRSMDDIAHDIVERTLTFDAVPE